MQDYGHAVAGVKAGRAPTTGSVGIQVKGFYLCEITVRTEIITI